MSKYDIYNKKIEEFKNNDPTDAMLNNFIDKMAFDEDLTPKEYTELLYKTLDLRKID